MNSEKRLSLNIVRKFFITNLLAAQAEQDRRILQEELLRQQQDFREVHQQDLIIDEGIAKIPKFYLR